MKILINDTKHIRTLQKQFEAEYPHLRLAFFVQRHAEGAGSPGNEQIDADKTLGEVRLTHETGLLEIVPEMTVAELEQRFGSVYGLWVQVFRLSGDVWLETTGTDGWTLAEHEEQARQKEQAG